MSEVSLYLPVKAFFERLGFEVKGEVVGCDLVATRHDTQDLLVVCELKLAFNLELLLQATERASLADEIWIAAPQSRNGKGRESDARFRQLCRRLGYGVLTVSHDSVVSILVSPASPMPRRDTKRRSRVLDEHRRRVGDPMRGGSSRVPVMTAYRQRALKCATALANGPLRPRDLRDEIPAVATMLRRNVYGWFCRVDRGLYALTDLGRAAVIRAASASADHEPRLAYLDATDA